MQDNLLIAILVVQVFILLGVLCHIGFFKKSFWDARLVKLNRHWKRMLLQKISQSRDWCKK